MGFILKILITGLAVLLGAYLLPGVHVSSFGVALLVAFVLSFLNTLVKPVLVILTIPVTILTLGLFLLVINAIIILFADGLIRDFVVDGFWWALLFSIVLSLLTGLADTITSKNNERVK